MLVQQKKKWWSNPPEILNANGSTLNTTRDSACYLAQWCITRISNQLIIQLNITRVRYIYMCVVQMNTAEVIQ